MKKVSFIILFIVTSISLSATEPKIRILFITPQNVIIDDEVSSRVNEYVNFHAELNKTRKIEYSDDVNTENLRKFDNASSEYLRTFTLERMITAEEAHVLASILSFDEINYKISLIDTNYTDKSILYKKLAKNKNLDFIFNVTKIHVKAFEGTFLIDVDILVYDVLREKHYKEKKKNYDFSEEELTRSRDPRLGLVFPLKTYHRVVGGYSTAIANCYTLKKRTYEEELKNSK